MSSDTLSDLGINDPTPQAASGTFVTPSTSKFQDVFAKWMDSYSGGYFTGHTFPSIEAKQFTIKIYDQNMKPVGMSTKYEYAGDGFHDGLIAVTVIKDANFMREAVKDSAHLSLIMSSGRYGYIDPTGKEIIPDEYYWASDFKNGLAIVHKIDKCKLTTLVINKQNQVQFQEEGYFSGEIGDNYIYIGDNYREPGYDKNGYNMDVPDSSKMNQPGSFYDYNWNRISIASRKCTSDEYGYWAANGDRINIPGYKSEMDAFSARFGKLYEKAEYIGKGFFKVKELPLAGTEVDYDVLNNLRNGVVDKDNKIIVPMGNYPDSEMCIVDTETSKLFEVNKDDGSGAALYSGTGKEVLDAGTFTNKSKMD